MHLLAWIRSIVVLAAAALVYSGPAAAGPWGADYFPNVPLTTQDGKVVRFYDDLLKGKSVAINLVYTRCTASCPLETAKMTQVQRIFGDRMGKDVFFYSISIDPKNDTPEAMKAYMEKYHIGPGWLFLTGKVEDIKLIAQKLGLSSLTDFSNRDGHMPSLMIGNEPSGRWMRQSAVDNSRFLAAQIGNFFGWKNTVPLQSYAVLQEPPKVDEGARMFKNRCGACHTVGKGDGIGPDLANVTKRREHCWVGRYIAEPDKMLEEKDPIAVELFAKYRNVRMPNLSMSPEDVALVLSHIEKESQAVVAQAKKDAASPQ